MKRDDSLPAQTTEAMEAQVRDAFAAAAGTITAGDLPPRPAPVRNSLASRAVWILRAWAPRARVRALVPVAAAASVTAIAVTAVVVPGLLNGAPDGAVASPAAPPRFFAGLTVDPAATGTGGVVTVVKIYRSGTGRPVPGAELTVPASQQIQSVSRLGSDRTFVAAAYDRKACVTHFTRFSVSAAGQIQRAAPLSVPSISGDVEQLASSADGKVLGFFLSACKPGLQVVAIHLATGQISRWRNAAVGGSPSLTADGSVLGFVSGRTTYSRKTFAWTIRTDAPAGPLFEHARKVLSLPTNVDDAILSPSGAQIYAETQADSGRGPLVLSLYRTSTGSLIRPVVRLSPGGKQLSLAVLTLDREARHLLAYGLSGGSLVKAFDLRTGRHFSLSVPHLAIDGGLSTLAW
jgi:hypothetical protein